jgi:hypothetical protein
MNFPSLFSLRRARLHLPVATLVALLQRSPTVQVLITGGEYILASPVGTVLRSTAAAAAALGAIDAFAGATTLIESNNQPSLTLPSGTAMQPVVFGVNNTANLGSWLVGGVFPPGLKLVAAEGGASLSGPGTLDATNAKNDIFNTTPILEGTPTTAGVYTLTLQAYEYGGLQGLVSNVFSYTVTVTGASSGGTSTPPSTTFDIPPIPKVAVDGHSSGDTLTLAAGASGLYQVTIRYSATDASKNLSGIRYNLWNPPAGNLLAFAGLFSNGGGGFFPETGSSGEVDQTQTLTPGDWYFWTDTQNSNGDSASTGAWTSGFVLHVVQGTGTATTTTPATSTLPADVPPNATVAVDGRSNGDTITITKGGSVSVTVRYSATDSSNNLSGIRSNVWGPPAGNTTPGAGYFSNGNGFVAQTGGSGQVSQIIGLTAGDWYFWTDAQNSHGDSTSTGGWTAGYVLHVVSP